MVIRDGESHGGFSLVELLVVLAIIVILAGMLVPTIRLVKDQARSLSCQNSMRQFGVACVTYIADNDGLNPNKMVGAGGGVEPDATQFSPYLTYNSLLKDVSGDQVHCPLTASMNGVWILHFYMNWWVSSPRTQIYPAATEAIAISQVLRTSEALLASDLSAGGRGGFHNGYANTVFLDGHVGRHIDDPARTAGATWADPGPGVIAEYLCKRTGDNKLKGFTY